MPKNKRKKEKVKKEKRKKKFEIQMTREHVIRAADLPVVPSQHFECLVELQKAHSDRKALSADADHLEHTTIAQLLHEEDRGKNAGCFRVTRLEALDVMRFGRTKRRYQKVELVPIFKNTTSQKVKLTSRSTRPPTCVSF